MGRRIAPEFETALREALADPTVSYADIAEKVGRHPDTIRYHAIKWGLERDSRALTDKQQEKIRRMLRANCWTYKQIAKGVGCSPETVRDAAMALGIIRPNGRSSQFHKQE
jgi:IS30 family transposase